MQVGICPFDLDYAADLAECVQEGGEKSAHGAHRAPDMPGGGTWLGLVFLLKCQSVLCPNSSIATSAVATASDYAQRKALHSAFR